ncbi:MAG: DUF1211 domain-containing protein [Methanobrevibacter sp.]|uniref:TMEM175 family protein n=1 Tax=Methanobrevibacter sp. TaxID=66852 RepID=UPI0025F462FA|nr:TMEM175 family protein [Methanobrevibacter sp.]MBR0271478.1 DUF1211 domain-containing protein [Methanobrevibacter sp.]
MKTDRFETFFDAIIAIIITVLVLKLYQPEQATWSAIWTLKIQYLTYLLCFIIIFNTWYNDHDFFKLIDEIDNKIVCIYGVLIFLLSLLPYFSAWLTLYFYSAHAQLIFGLLFISTNLTYTFSTYLICKANPENEILSKINFLKIRRYIPNIIILFGMILTCTIFIPATYITCLIATSIWIIIVRMPNNITEDKNRFEALIDAIVAIILTVIVLEITMASGGNITDLLNLKVEFLAYIISFIVCFNYWMYNNDLFNRVSRINYDVIWSMGFSLFVLSLIPYFTKFVSENFYSAVAQSAYGISFILIIVSWIMTTNNLKRINNNINLHHMIKNNYPLYIMLTITIIGFIMGHIFYPPLIILFCFVSIIFMWATNIILN